MPNADVRDVLRYYEELTGKRLILDQTIQGQLNININTPVTKDEAVKIIETTLLLNGFSLVPGDGGLTKVLGISKNPRQAGVSIYSSVEQLPDAELVASLLFRLRYVDPTELQQILQQYIPAQTFTSFIALPKSNSLLITESTSVIRRLAQLVREADIPPAEVIQEFIPLEYADATKAVEFLNSIFEKKDAQAGGARPGAPGVARPRVNPGVPGTPGAPSVAVPAVLETPGLANALGTLSEDSLIIGKIQLTADVRTNRVHVVTRPVNMRFVKRLLAEYDTATKFGEPLKIRLRFVSARDVLPILVQSLTDPGADGAGAGATAGQPGQPRPTGTAGSNSATNLNRTSATSTGSGGLGGSSSGGSLNLTQGLETQPVDTTPQAVTVGTTSIIADPRDNAIIIRGGAEARLRAERVISLLDVRAPQVQISAVIGELSLGNSTEYGVNYVVRNTNPATVFTRFDGTSVIDRGNLTTTNGTSGATTASSILSALASSLGGFNGVGAIIRGTNSFDIILKALEGTNRFKTISRPTIFTINNNKAVIASGQEIAVPTSTISSVGTVGTGNTLGNGLAQQSNIQFKSVTLQLEVVPLVNRENEVTLDILQKIDSVVAGASVNIAGTNVPTIATRYIRSKVSVPNNATVVLGGLIQQTESKSQSGIPYLSRIPVIGALFRDQQRSANRSELVILIRPIVTNSDAQVYRNRAEEQKRLLLKAPRAAELEDQLYPPGIESENPPADPPSRVAIPVNPPRRTVTTTTTTRTTVRRPAAVVSGGKETVPVKKKKPVRKPAPASVREPAPEAVRESE